MRPEGNPKKLIPKEQIQERIAELAREIAAKYKDQNLLLVGVLKGGVIVLTDLARELSEQGLDDIEYDFVEVTSYGSNNQSSREPRLIKDISTDISNRHILLVEDIVDTGYSIDTLRRIFEARKPASLATFAMLSKNGRREINVPIEYIGFEIENVWVEGYGLDTNQKGRCYPYIGVRPTS